MTTDAMYFFSYARNDGDFVLKLAKDLRGGSANVWIDQLDILGGQRWDRAVEQALSTCQGMILVLTPESVKSNNVMDEASYALRHGKLVVPVLHKACDIPFRLERLHYVDFTSNYQTGLADLFKALGIDHPGLAPVPPYKKAKSQDRTHGQILDVEHGDEQATPSRHDEVRLRTQPPSAAGGNKRFNARIRGVLIGFACGLVVDLILTVVFQAAYERTYGLFLGWTLPLQGAITGSVAGNSRVRIGSASVGAVFVIVALVVGAAFAVDSDFFHIFAFTAGLGAILGAIVGFVLERRKATQVNESAH